MSDTPSLQKQLRDRYQIEEWRKILHGIFPDGTVKFFSTPQAIKASQEFVKSTLQLGTIDLPDGNTIALLEVETSDQVKLARNRVGLRNFVANFIDEAGASAVLAVFHQANSDDWRLTYAARQTILDEDTFEITTIETAPRRFTFLLGKNEPCRTATSRLATLLEKGDDLNLADIEKAFSVETLSKDFFKKYKIHYQAFVDHLLSPAEAATTRESFGLPVIDDEKEQDKADKPIRDFVKTLLGRLVFLHFLQKKGWLGCPKGGKKWKGGDPDFLQGYLRLAKTQGEIDFFHSKYLSPLFFEALNLPDRPGDLFPLTDSRLPYLNGGLFEEDGDEQRGIDFPGELFARLLDFFGEYNFTIDENDPEDHEVGIDPEMLGHIFENLLEDNKDKGAFYTPKAIVSYMSRQSLLHYLQTHLGEDAELGKLLNEKDLANHPAGSFVARHKTRIGELLDEVKICDPAIGSGAFPIGLLQEILWTQMALKPKEENTPLERSKLKRRIIQNSIHGVDIDPGAIEIARLRFWLALVVDEDEPRPLPNLDYKIHRADSLIEYIRGEPVNLGTEPPKDGAARVAVEKLIAAKQSLFTAQKLPDKRAAWFDLYRALAQLAQAEFTWMRNDLGLFGSDMEKVAQLDRGVKEFGQWIGRIDSIRREKVHHQETLLDQLRAWFDDIEKPTFLWNLHFGEVFAKGGFDVVIQNPPYLSHEKLLPNSKQFYSDKFDSWDPFGDIFCYFIELSTRLTNSKGITCSLTSNSFLRADYGHPLRKVLRKNQRIREVINIEESQVFENATVNVVMLLATNMLENSSGNDYIACRSALMKPNVWDHVSSHGYKCCHETLARDVWSLCTPEEFSVLGRMERFGVTPQRLDFKIRLGIATGSNPAFLVNRQSCQEFIALQATNREIIKPVLQGRDVDRYYVPEPHKFLILSKNGVNLPRDYPHLAAHLESFGNKFKQRGAKGQNWWNLRACSFYEDFEKDRVVWIELTDKPRFAVCRQGVYLLNTAYFMLPDEDHPADFLVALFNSTLCEFYVRNIAQTSGMGTTRWFKEYVSRIPIPPASPADKARLAELAASCAEVAKKDDIASLAVLETEINQIVYRLFDLTPEEIALIESSLAS